MYMIIFKSRDMIQRFAIMHFCVNYLVALGNNHFDSPLIKHQSPSQRSRFNSRSGKHRLTLLYLVTMLLKKYRIRLS